MLLDSNSFELNIAQASSLKLPCSVGSQNQSSYIISFFQQVVNQFGFTAYGFWSGTFKCGAVDF